MFGYALAISPNPANTADGSPPPNPNNDQLIITDAGPNQNLRVCCGLMGNYIVARYDGWTSTTGARNASSWVELPAPLPDAQDDFAGHFTDVLCGCPPDGDWPYNSFDVAGDMVFIAEHRGPIHVRRASDLSEVTRLYAGPEMNGVIFWYDVVDLMRATRRSNGEYLITTTGTDRRAVNQLIRWTPPAP